MLDDDDDDDRCAVFAAWQLGVVDVWNRRRKNFTGSSPTEYTASPVGGLVVEPTAMAFCRESVLPVLLLSGGVSCCQMMLN